MTAEKLAAEWLEAKRAEQEATSRRIAIESDLLKLVTTKPEGSSTTTLTNGVKVKTTGKLSYKTDVDKLLVLTSTWPSDAKPVKTKVEADETLLRAIRSERPDLWRQIAPAITVKELKTSVVVEEAANGL